MRRLLRRAWFVLTKRRREAELAEEIALHKELARASNTFGSAALALNQSRDVWIPVWLQDVAQDARFAVRLLLKDRRFTLVPVIALSFGVGSTTTVFTFIDAALFKDLPFEQPRQILNIGTRDQRGRESGASYLDFRDWQRSSHTFAAVAANTQSAFIVSDPDHAAERLRGAYVSANTFALLRVAPMLGRGLRAEDDEPGAPAVVVLGEAVWRDRYASDPEILAKIVRVNDVTSMVVGVMPARFAFPGTAEVWAPLMTMAGVAAAPRNARTLNVIGRLAEGATAAQARAELAVVAEQLAREYPDTNRGIVPAVAPPFDALRRFIAPMLAVLMGAVVFVLLIACANVATLLLSRAAQRSREIAIRTSLGASRWRIVRQLMIESLLLAFLGGGGGLLLSFYGVRYFGAAFDARELASPERLATPYWIDLSIDMTIFGFVTAICVGSALLFGLVPALHISTTRTNDALKEGSRSAGSARASRWSGVLMVIELALTVVLLAGAGLVARNFIATYRVNLVIDTSHVLTARIALPLKPYGTVASRKAFLERLQQQLQPTADVTAVTVASDAPFVTMGGGTIRGMSVDGAEPVPGESAPRASYVYVGRDYLRTLGLPVLEGRIFNDAERVAGPPAAIVNRAFADKFFPAASALGRRIRRAAPQGALGGAQTVAPGPWLTIVGVVPTLPQFGPRDVIVEPTVYAPVAAEPEPGRFVTIIARGLDARTTAAYLRERVRAIDPNLALYSILTADDNLAIARWGGRLIAALFGTMAVIALTLSAVGLFALTAQAVTQRTQEIGVRMALGAQISEVVWLFLRRACLHLAVGLAIGMVGALAVGRLLQSVLDRTQPRDPLTLTSISVLIVIVAIVASALPARRAARIDPVVALRHE